VAEKCLEVIRLVELVGAKGNANVVSDAATAIYLAQAGLMSAIVNVNINLKSIKDANFVLDWSVRRDDLLARAATSVDAAKRACAATLGVTL
jgi:formiminotetrahydrofolate cyclodeaminase